ncbi:hypothetical protein MYX84_10590 [Acidobacteria bacterium AH-259-O06]|nr:hypothetical protein [Acidobacteria bacterium AH-259-O06]
MLVSERMNQIGELGYPIFLELSIMHGVNPEAMPFKFIKGQFAPRLGRLDSDSVQFIPTDFSLSALLSWKTVLACATLSITVLTSGITVAQQTNLYVVRDTVTDCLNVLSTLLKPGLRVVLCFVPGSILAAGAWLIRRWTQWIGSIASFGRFATVKAT